MKISSYGARRALELIGVGLRRVRYERLRQRFADYTMVLQPAFRHNLELARSYRHVKGIVVECGVWRGGMSAALATVLGPGRTYYLFDSFEGLPAPKDIDGAKARDWAEGKDGDSYFYDNCRAQQETAAEAMRLAGVQNAHLVKGWFENTLPHFNPPEPIAILRLDGDWYDSTMCCLTHLYDKVAPGGLIVIDDYHIWEGCTRAVHDFLSQRKLKEPVRQFNNVLAYIVKQ
jgi:O-methyltransferase